MMRIPCLFAAVSLAFTPACAQSADTNRFVEVRGASLYVETSGAGEPILFLHGGASHFDNGLAKQRDYFATFRKVIGFDRRGHGHSPDDGKPFSYVDMAEDTAALIETLGIAPVDIVGHSDGGDIALIVARDHPKLVRRIVISGANLASGISPEETARRAEWPPEKVAETIRKLDAKLPPWFRPDYERVAPNPRWEEFLTKSWRLWMTPVVIPAADLASIRAPVLVMAGDRDFASLEDTAKIFRGLPNAQLAILPGTGHGTFNQRPELSNLIIRQFLDAPDTARSAPGAAANAPDARIAALHRAYDERWSARMVPLLVEAIRFPTYAGNAQAFADQKRWLESLAGELGFSFRDTGMVTEIELPGPPGAPVLGLIVHGDVVPVDDHWTFPPFEAAVRDGMVQGRGAADDKGPLVQALLAMKVLSENAAPRTYAVRLLVGSDEESGSTDMDQYLKAHRAPDLSLVLDSDFPVVIGEKAGNMLYVETRLGDRGEPRIRVVSLEAGIAGNIVPDVATAVLALRDTTDPQVFDELEKRIRTHPLPEGIGIGLRRGDATLTLSTRGKAAHAGVNPEGGRNALTALARILAPELPRGGARDLLEYAQLAGTDLHGSALGFTEVHPQFGRLVVVPTLLRTSADGIVKLGVNIRSNPGNSGQALRERLVARIDEIDARNGASLSASGGFTSRPLAHDPDAKIVKRLVASYARATGRSDPPTVSAGGTYQKRVPNSIAFGMWFPGKPYPGHDVDEKIAIEDLHRGEHVLLEGLADLVYREPLAEPFKP